MAERPRELGYFKGLGQFEARFKVKELRFAPIDMNRYIKECLYYNSPTGNFHKGN